MAGQCKGDHSSVGFERICVARENQSPGQVAPLSIQRLQDEGKEAIVLTFPAALPKDATTSLRAAAVEHGEFTEVADAELDTYLETLAENAAP